ncbi:flavodoxin family protein [Atrimonas thermophila]|uniref:flavodoxin family protein n=1 Tax=Atrimonas thermophila TaxID=3064161 RepID=UPI00399CA2DE
MKALIIYFSVHHGNTEKIARAIAETLKAELKTPDEVTPQELLQYDLLGFGSGIFFGKHHRKIVDFIQKLPQVQGKNALVFSTSGMGRKSFNQHLSKLLEEKGFNVVGSFTCRGYDTYGPLKLIGGINRGRPNQDDLEKAKRFAREIAEKIKSS